MENNNLPIQYKASQLTILFPDNEHLKEEEKNVIQNAVTNGGIVTSEGRSFIAKESIPRLLATDKKGANKVYNDTDDNDKYENGKNKYISTPALKKEMNKRIEEPRSTLVREKIRYGEQCVNAFRDAPELEKERQIEAERIATELPKLTSKKMKAENITKCQLSGEELNNNAEGHHVKRKADEPREATNLENIVIVTSDVHDAIHANDADTPEGLKKFIKEREYNTPDNLK